MSDIALLSQITHVFKAIHAELPQLKNEDVVEMTKLFMDAKYKRYGILLQHNLGQTINEKSSHFLELMETVLSGLELKLEHTFDNRLDLNVDLDNINDTLKVEMETELSGKVECE